MSQLALFGAIILPTAPPTAGRVIAAQNCVQQVDGSWLLTNLLRGRYGTEWASGLHAKWATASSPSTELGSIFWRSPAAVLAFPALPGDHRRPLDRQRRQSQFRVSRRHQLQTAVANLAQRQPSPSSADWSLDWLRRTRVDGAWRDGVEVALGETTEAYDVEIWTTGYWNPQAERCR